MSNDFVRIYFVTTFMLSLLAHLFMDGKPRSNINYEFKKWFVDVVFMIPIYGRIMGWW